MPPSECGDTEEEPAHTDHDRQKQHAGRERGGPPHETQDGVNGSLCELIESVAAEPLSI
jgi:hypothetical protein